MFRFFENLVDPFAPHDGKTPPGRILPYLRSQYGNFGRWNGQQQERDDGKRHGDYLSLACRLTAKTDWDRIHIGARQQYLNDNVWRSI